MDNSSIPENQAKQKLTDVTKSGRVRPWAEYKQSALEISKLMYLIDWDGRASRMNYCGDDLGFLKCSDHPEEHPMSLVQANFCRDRLCPMCNSRRTLKMLWQLVALLIELQKHYPHLKWAFLTLTERNTNNLAESIPLMMKGWDRLMKTRKLSEGIAGYMRVLEITRNNNVLDKEWYGSYHPHFHILLAIEPKYYTKRFYIGQEMWVELWMKARRLEYKPIVDIRTLRDLSKLHLGDPEQGEFSEQGEVLNGLTLENFPKGVLEAAKYPFKLTDLLTDATYKYVDGKRKLVKSWRVPDEEAAKRVLEFGSAIKGRRLIGYGGILKAHRILLNLQDVEADDADLIHPDHDIDQCNCKVCGAVRELYKYHFDRIAQDYYLNEKGVYLPNV